MNDTQFVTTNNRIDEIIDRILILENIMKDLTKSVSKLRDHQRDPHAHQI